MFACKLSAPHAHSVHLITAIVMPNSEYESYSCQTTIEGSQTIRESATARAAFDSAAWQNNTAKGSNSPLPLTVLFFHIALSQVMLLLLTLLLCNKVTAQNAGQASEKWLLLTNQLGSLNVAQAQRQQWPQALSLACYTCFWSYRSCSQPL